MHYQDFIYMYNFVIIIVKYAMIQDIVRDVKMTLN